MPEAWLQHGARADDVAGKTQPYAIELSLVGSTFSSLCCHYLWDNTLLMAKKQSVLERMAANPRADWKIKDIERLCHQVGLELVPPSTGSHYRVSSPFIQNILTVPARRPIKAVYIKDLVSFANAHIDLEGRSDEQQ